MKKIIGFMALLCMVLTLGIGTIGCSEKDKDKTKDKDKAAEKKVEEKKT